MQRESTNRKVLASPKRKALVFYQATPPNQSFTNSALITQVQRDAARQDVYYRG